MKQVFILSVNQILSEFDNTKILLITTASETMLKFVFPNLPNRTYQFGLVK